MLKKIALLSVLFLIFISCQNETKAKIMINEKTYTVEVANTQEKRSKGLMFRKHLPENTGMLFVFSYEDYRYFYMKNTLIPLDIAFFDSQMKIVSIKQMEPLDETTVPSDKKAMYALEMNKGFFEKEKINVGDCAKLLTSIKYFP
ncbi:MAG: DUF192 domain-containing protein [Spirochaetales bacterium]|nr:DUF192 domain-containing protein [Spirochaetales bacterium]